MKKNMGKTDSTIRLIAGFILAALGFHFASPIIGLLGFILVVTSIFGVCPAYLPFKFNTCCDKECKTESKTDTTEPPADDKPDEDKPDA